MVLTMKWNRIQKEPILVPGTLKTYNEYLTSLLDCFKVSYVCSYISKLKYAETMQNES